MPASWVIFYVAFGSGSFGANLSLAHLLAAKLLLQRSTYFRLKAAAERLVNSTGHARLGCVKVLFSKMTIDFVTLLGNFDYKRLNRVT